MKKVIGVLMCATMVMTLLAGCGSGGTSGSETGTAQNGEDSEKVKESGSELNIAVLPYSMAEEFGVDIVDGAKAKAEELGGISVVSPDPAADMQKEIAIFEDLIQQGVDAICVAPIDADAIKPYIEKARNAGIVVVDYDIETAAEVDAKVLADNKAGGALAAEKLIDKMGKEGTILLVSDLPGVTTTEERISGFREKVEEIAPDVKFIDQLSSGTRDTHRTTVENMLQAYPEITGIFAPDGDRTLGAYTACKANNRSDVLIAGYDATGEQIEVMKNDGESCNLICSVALYPKKIGATALETAYKLLQGEIIEDVVWTELGLLEADAVGEFED